MTNQPLPPSSHFSLSQMVRLLLVIALSVRLDSPGVVCFIVTQNLLWRLYRGWEERAPRPMEFELDSLPCHAFEQTWAILCITCSVSYVLGFRMCFSLITTQKLL